MLQGKASLEETVVLTECQNFVGKLILLDAFEKNQVPAQLEELKDFMLLSSWREPLPVVVQDLDLPAESDAAIKMEYSTVNYWRQAPRLVDDAELEADSKVYTLTCAEVPPQRHTVMPLEDVRVWH